MPPRVLHWEGWCKKDRYVPIRCWDVMLFAGGGVAGPFASGSSRPTRRPIKLFARSSHKEKENPLLRSAGLQIVEHPEAETWVCVGRGDARRPLHP